MIYTFPYKKEEYNIGVISDTHGLLRPEAKKALYGSDLILHAGDIGEASIIKKLQEIAPVIAVKGNVDTIPSLFEFPATETIQVDNTIIYLLHNISDLDFKPESEKINIVVYGHSHKASIETKENVLYFNPGSAGKRRFNFPITTGEINIKNGVITGKIVKLFLE